MTHKNYKTSRKYKCPYCDAKLSRSELVNHIDKRHEDMIPENYSANRVVYDYINRKNHGKCMICGKEVYNWNDKICRYNNLCDNPKCREEVRNIALSRHLRVYNKPTLLNDPEHQASMLANRKISGFYTFSDGGKIGYTGSYEKKCLEFMDKILNIPSKDIQTPGPTLKYQYNGEDHFWITDIYYIPANLVIEVKDGGSNPNNRSMVSYREKQTAKEVMITKLEKFSYLRLTNNNFDQLLDILTDMKYEALEEEIPNVKIRINEEVGGMPPNRPPEAYIIPYGMNNVFSGVAYGDSILNKIALIDDEGNLSLLSEVEFYSKYQALDKLYYTKSDIQDKINEVHKFINFSNSSEDVKQLNRLLSETNKSVSSAIKYIKSKPKTLSLAEVVIGSDVNSIKDILISNCFRRYDENKEKILCECIENGIKFKKICASIGKDKTKLFSFEPQAVDVIDCIDGVNISISPNGYYGSINTDHFYMSDYFTSIDNLVRSDIFKVLANEIRDYNDYINKLKEEDNHV